VKGRMAAGGGGGSDSLSLSLAPAPPIPPPSAGPTLFLLVRFDGDGARRKGPGDFLRATATRSATATSREKKERAGGRAQLNGESKVISCARLRIKKEYRGSRKDPFIGSRGQEVRRMDGGREEGPRRRIMLYVGDVRRVPG
jgi:hypothetical protein